MAIPVVVDEAGQEIFTRDHGVVKVDTTSWMDGGFHIVRTPNGAYQHINGLPVQDEGQLVAAFGSNTEDLEEALDWFRHRHEQEANPPKPIGFRSDNTPVFADGSIPEEADLYNFFSPGPVLSAAIIRLHNYRQRQATGAAAPVSRPAPRTEPAAPQVEAAAPAPKAEPKPRAPRRNFVKSKKKAAPAKAKAEQPAAATG